MNIFIAAAAALFSVFAVAVIGYISMSAGIGPWVELIVALLALLLSRLFCRGRHAARGAGLIAFTTVAAGIAGIAATGCGFTLPMLYFLDKNLFMSWLVSPLYFCAVVGGMVLVSGLFAFAVARLFGQVLLSDPNMPFPIGQMVARVVGAQQSVKKSLDLIVGMGAAFLWNGVQFVSGLPRVLKLFAGKAWSYVQLPAIAVPLDQFIIFVAIGFVAGELLLIPLLVGVASRIFIAGPLHQLFFTRLSFESFQFAFGAGLVLQEAAFSFWKLPKALHAAIKGMRAHGGGGRRISTWLASWQIFGLITIALLSAIGYFTYFGSSLLAQGYVLFFTLIWVYQLMLIGGKTGLAPVGRFATFVMLPGIFLFGWTSLMTTLVSLFVSIAGGVAVDMMFGRRMAAELGMDEREVNRYQLLGLIVASVVMGGIFWLIINHFGLGSVELLAQKGQARALLLSVFNFDYVVLLIGLCFGLLFHFLRINTALVFTGLVFPVTQSLMLVTGGVFARLTRDKQAWEPFWSGVFAAGSLWMLLRVFA
ncbi:MAG: OPT/YSL family transporter [Candidatus Dependentiae bacterium]|nr:OPT/YSL family transporter [Candidatus Dependentiae bacterium]